MTFPNIAIIRAGFIAEGMVVRVGADSSVDEVLAEADFILHERRPRALDASGRRAAGSASDEELVPAS